MTAGNLIAVYIGWSWLATQPNLNSVTAFVNYATLGYGDIVPLAEWRLLGPITAMNGVLLFGWSTAVIFEVLRRTLTQSVEISTSQKFT